MKSIINNCIRAMVENKALQTLSKKILARPDRVIGRISRAGMSLFNKVQPATVLFSSFQGDYTCNPKYISEKLHEMSPETEIIWAARPYSLDRPESFPPYVKLVRQYSSDFFKAWSKAKVIVVNSVDAYKYPIPLKSSQTLLQTWHGSLGIKRFGKDRYWTLLRAGQRMSKITSAVISNSSFETSVYKDTLWNSVPILELGHARNDILIDNNYSKAKYKQLRERLCAEYQLNLETRFVLYAPTFRNALNIDCYDIDVESVLTALQTRFGGEWRMLIRMHPTARKKDLAFIESLPDTSHIIDVTNYPDIEECMLVADAMITDYSSAIFDFLLTRRPGFIYATDIDLYNNERGFYYNLNDTPFPVSKNNTELEQSILHFNAKKYKNDVELFLTQKGCIDDGHASERIAKMIINLLLNDTSQ